jgi:hypothetical protein
VSVDVGRVSVPVFDIVEMTGEVKVNPATVAAVLPKDTLVDPTVTAEFVKAALPILLNVLLEPLIVLFVSVSVVALPTIVSVEVGKVSVPVLLIVLITGAVNVSPATVEDVPPSAVDVLPIVTVLLVKALFPILVNVLVEPLILLFVNVSVVAFPTSVSVLVGNVSVPVFVMVEMTGAEIVGAVPNTRFPVPVSFEMIPANCEEVVAAKTLRLSDFKGTTEVSTATVPDEVIVPPVNPVPAVIEVTVPTAVLDPVM